jgi:hypothetical protein
MEWKNVTRYLLSLIAGGLLLVALAGACDGGGNGGQPSATATGAASTPTATAVASPTATGPPFPFEGPVGIDLTTYGVFHNQGEPILLTITVAAGEPITLYYRTTQRYEIVITDQADEEVWRWSKDKSFGQVLEEVTLEENETLVFSETWDQRDNDGQPVPPGNYTVTATSLHCDANHENCGQLSASATLQVRAP